MLIEVLSIQVNAHDVLSVRLQLSSQQAKVNRHRADAAGTATPVEFFPGVGTAIRKHLEHGFLDRGVTVTLAHTECHHLQDTASRASCFRRQ